MSLGSVRLMFWYSVAACSCLQENQDVALQENYLELTEVYKVHEKKTKWK